MSVRESLLRGLSAARLVEKGAVAVDILEQGLLEAWEVTCRACPNIQVEPATFGGPAAGP